MSDLAHLILALALGLLLDRLLRSGALRTYLAAALIGVGGLGGVLAGQTHWLGVDLGLLSVMAVGIGGALMAKRRRFAKQG